MESLRRNEIPFQEIGIKKLSGIEKDNWSHILPGRNLLFIAQVAELHPCDPVDIYFAATNGEMPLVGGDKSLSFLTMVNNLLHPFGKKVRTPIADYTKTDL